MGKSRKKGFRELKATENVKKSVESAAVFRERRAKKAPGGVQRSHPWLKKHIKESPVIGSQLPFFKDA